MAETKGKLKPSKIALYVTIGLVLVVLVYMYMNRSTTAKGPAMSSTGVTPPATGNEVGPMGPQGPPGPAGPAGPPASHNKDHKGHHNGGN